MAVPIIQLNAISKSFGGIRAVESLSFSVNANEVVGLIGPNGSGKSTTVNLLSGALPLTSGEIFLDGQQISQLPENQRVSKGLARTFQTATCFTGFTTKEQVLLGCFSRITSSNIGSVFRTRASRTENERQTKKVAQLLELVGLASAAEDPVESLSSGQQRLLMIATALASEPKLLLVDEPAAGMVASERKALGDLLLKIKAAGVSVIVIEHHMALIMEICDRIVVLNFGQKIAEGVPQEIRTNRKVIDAYLGENH
ncbi:MAG: ABC transporter ATP-binding protein [Afipia sp.]|nr:ABC transporter ATP-binding protein [Afipia sp.]